MKIVLFLVTFYFISCACEPDDAYCCNPGTSIIADDENVCVDLKNNNITTPMKLTCKNFTIADDTELNYVITDDGRMVVLLPGRELHLDSDKFCVANRSLNIDGRFLIVCEEEEVEEILDESVVAYCSLVSVVFLTLTVLVYCALSEIRDIQGKSIINFCGSLALGFAINSTLKLHLAESNLSCKAQGFLVYFFFISSFFWSNAISIQILLNIRRPIKSDSGWKEFLWYALYAWGCPTVITVSMVIANSLPGYHRKPGIGLYTCFFFNMRYQWQYMYSIMIILLLANACIFFYVSTHLCRHTFASNHIKALKYKFVMTIRLIIVMGLPWIFEMASTLSGPHIFWAITDIFNMLQGLIMFLLLVVFRKRVIKAMYKRGWLDCISGVIERHLAVGEDVEEDVVPHTMDFGLQEGLAK